MNKILLISLGWEQEKIFSKLKKHKHKIYATYHTNKIDIKLDFYEYCDPRDLNTLLNICLKFKIKHFISDQCDYSNFAVNFLRKYFQTHDFNFLQTQATSNKYLMRLLCKNENIVQPRYQLCRSVEDIKFSLNFIDYPIIFKPIDNRGSKGINVIKSKKNIDKKFYQTLVHSNTKEVLVESYISGTHISIDSIINNNQVLVLGIGEKKHSDKDRKIINEVNYPAKLEIEVQNTLLNTHSKVIKALKIDRGIAHAEYIIDKKGRPFLIEIAGRGGGVLTSCSILNIISKVDTIDYLYREAIGLKTKLKINKDKNKYFVSLKFLNFKPGLIKKVKLNEVFLNSKNVVKYKLFIKEGQLIKKPASGSERHGFIIIKYKNQKELKELEMQIHKSIKIINAK